MLKNPRVRLFTVTVLAGLVSSLGALALPANSYAVSNQTVIQQTNAQRAANGLPALVWNGKLSNSAWLKAQDMCAKDYWAHTAPDGATGWTFMSQSGYAYAAAGENLARGFSEDGSVVTGWMASPGHRANVLNSAYADIGVAAMACDFGGSQTTIVVAHYGATSHLLNTVVPTAAKPIARMPATTSPVTAPVPVPTPIPTPKPIVMAVKAVPAPRKPAEQPIADKKAPENQNRNTWSLLWKRYLTLVIIKSHPSDKHAGVHQYPTR